MAIQGTTDTLKSSASIRRSSERMGEHIASHLHALNEEYGLALLIWACSCNLHNDSTTGARDKVPKYPLGLTYSKVTERVVSAHQDQSCFNHGRRN